MGRGRPALKLGRASEHLEALRNEIESYRSSDAYGHAERFDPNDGWIYLTLTVKMEPPLETWALLFGDLVHNVRSALDHLAWQLDSSPDRDTAYPIKVARIGRPSP